MPRAPTKIALLALLALTAPAFAHVFLDSSDPAVGATLKTAPTEVKINFTGDINAAGSSIQVLDSAGNQVDKKDFHGDPKDKTLGTVSLPALAPGTYKVVWNATSKDTHKTHGDFTFTLKPAPPTTTKQNP